MAQPDKLRVLYDALNSQYNLGTFDEFKTKMQDEKKRRAFYDGVSSAYNLGTFDEFNGKIMSSFATVQPTTGAAGASAQAAPSPAPVAPVAPVAEQATETPAPEKPKPITDIDRKAFEQTLAGAKQAVKQSEGVRERAQNMGSVQPLTMQSDPQVAYNPETGKMETSYGALDGKRYKSPEMAKMASRTEVDKWRQDWEANTEEGRRQKELRDKQWEKDFDDFCNSTLLMQNNDRNNSAEKAWADAEARTREARNKAGKETYSKPYLSGGREMRRTRAGEFGYASRVAYLQEHDLDKLYDEAWANLGEEGQTNAINEAFIKLQSHYKGADEQLLQKAAEELARQQSDRRMYMLAVEKNLPEGDLAYLARKIVQGNSVFQLVQGFSRLGAGTTGDMAAAEQAEQMYGSNGDFWTKTSGVGGTVLGFTFDPLTLLTAGAGKLTAEGVTWLGGKWLAGRGATQLAVNAASRKFATSMSGRILTGMAAGAGNFGAYEFAKEGLSQWQWGGHINPETGENEGYSFAEMASSGGHGLMMGAATGWISPTLSPLSQRLTRATTSTAGKMAVNTAMFGTTVLTEGTIFSVPEWIEGSRDAWDVWTDNQAMMLGFKGQGVLKSAFGVLGDMKSPARGRGGAFDLKGFETKLRERLDGNPDLRLTEDEQRELDARGYGDLKELVADKEFVDEANANRAPSPKSKEIAKNGEVKSDGEAYISLLQEMMQDNSISEAARAKMYYLATGRRVPMSTIMGGSIEQDGDGYIVNTYGVNGVITSRRHKTKRGAEAEMERVNRQMEFNYVAAGENYKDKAIIEELGIRAAENILYKYGRQLHISNTQDLLRAYGEIMRMKPEKRSELEQEFVVSFHGEMTKLLSSGKGKFGAKAVRESVNEAYDVDIDKVLAKEPKRRSEIEQTALEEYIRRLYPEGAFERTADGAEGGGPDPAQPSDPSMRLITGETPEETATSEGVKRSAAYERGYNAAYMGWQDITIEMREVGDEAAKDAYEGMAARIKDDADMAARKLREEYMKQSSGDENTLGLYRKALLKKDDKPVYVVDGRVANTGDGTMIDLSNSDQMVIVYNPETGERETLDVKDLLRVEEHKTAEQLEEDIEKHRADELEALTSIANGKVIPYEGAEVEVKNDKGETVKGKVVSTNYKENEDGSVEAESYVVALEDGTQIEVSEEELQRIHDEIALEDWKKRREAAAAETAEETPVTAGESAEAPPPAPAETPAAPAEVKGAPQEYTPDMEIVIRDEDGQEKRAIVKGRVRYDADTRAFVPDPEGQMIEYYADGGELMHDHKDKLDEKVVSYTPVEEETTEPAAPATETPAEGEQPNPTLQTEPPAAPQPAAPAAEAPAPAAEQPAAPPAMPMTAEGEPDYYAATPERTHSFIYNESELERSDADDLVGLKLNNAQKELETAQRNTPKFGDRGIGDNLGKLKAARAKQAQDIEAAQKRVDYWQAVHDKQQEVLAAEKAAEEQQAAVNAQAETAPAETPGAPEAQAETPTETATAEEQQAAVTETSTFLDVVKTLYSKGKKAASSLYQRSFFDIAKTPNFMKKIGLTGDKFTVRYGVIARHLGKDGEHDLPSSVWEQLPDALQKPFAITRYFVDEEKKQQKGFRLYTTLQLPNGSYVVVSVEVKNAGRDIEVNAINTVFGRDAISKTHDEVIYVGENITPEQQSLLDGNNPHQYPDARESSDGKGTNNPANEQENAENSSQGNAPTAETAGTETPGTPETPANPDYTEENTTATPAEKPAENKPAAKPAKKTAAAKPAKSQQADSGSAYGIPGKTIDKKAETAVRKASLEDFTKEDKDHPYKTGVRHDGEKGLAISTNGFILATSKEAYDEANKDKTVARNGLPINGRYPDVFRVIPDFKNCDTVEGVTVDDILRSAVVITEAMKPFDVNEYNVFVRMPNGSLYRADLTLKAASMAKRLGYTTITCPKGEGDKMIVFRKGDSNTEVVMSMPVRSIHAEGKSIVIDAGSSDIRSDAEALRFIRPKLPKNAESLALLENVITDLLGKVDGETAERLVWEEKKTYGEHFEREIKEAIRKSKTPEQREFLERLRKRRLPETARDVESAMPQFRFADERESATTPAQRLAAESAVEALRAAGIEVSMDTDEMRSVLEESAGRVQEMAVEEANGRFNKQLESLTEENADKVVFSLGRPSTVLLSAGVEDKPMKLYGNKVVKKMKKHGFSLEELRDLPGAVADPIAVFDNYGKDGNRSILTELKTAQGNFLVTVSVGKGQDVDFNVVPSLFGKGEENIADWINRGLATYINKEKALNYLHHSALRAVTLDNQEPNSENPDYPHNSAPIAESHSSSKLNSVAKVVENFENPKVSGEFLQTNEEKGKEDSNRSQFLKTSRGDIYGFVKDGKVYLDPSMLNPNTPIHEYSHLWDTGVRKSNPELWKRGVAVLKEFDGGRLWQEVVSDPNYSDIAHDENLVASEVKARLTGERGAEYFERAAKEAAKGKDVLDKAERFSVIARVKEWLKDVWQATKAWLAGKSAFADKWSKEELDSLTAEDFAYMTLRDLAEGRNPNVESRRINGKELMAVHNISAENLEKSLGLGGMAMPSIAVTKARTGHTQFGEISLIFDSSTVNPEANPKNTVWDRDAWTPRFPKTEVKLSERAVADIREKIEGLVKPEERIENLNLDSANMLDYYDRNGGDMAAAYAGNRAMKQAYLAATGKRLRIPMTEKTYGWNTDTLQEILALFDNAGIDPGSGAAVLLYRRYGEGEAEGDIVKEVGKTLFNEMYKRAPSYYDSHPKIRESYENPSHQLYMNAIGAVTSMLRDLARNGGKVPRVVDNKAARELVDSKVNSDDKKYRQWLAELFGGIVEKTGIRNEKDPFTPSGNRRSFESTHDEVNIKNILRAMLREPEKAAAYFAHPIFAAAKRLHTLEGIRQEGHDRISPVSEEELKKWKSDINDRVLDIAGKIGNSGSDFRADYDITDIIAKHGEDAKGMYDELHKWRPRFTMSMAETLAGIVREIRRSPVDFLEAKPRRIVGFDEVRLAVVPKGTPKSLVDALRQRGIKVKTYDKTIEGDRQRVVMESTERDKLQFRFVGKKGAANADKAEGGTRRMDNLRVAEEMEKKFSEETGRKTERIEKLRNSRDAEITGSEFPVTGDYSVDRVSAINYAKGLRGTYTNKDTGKSIELVKGNRHGGYKEVVKHDSDNPAHILSVAAIPQLIENAIYITSEANTDSKIKADSFDYYVCGLKINGEDYTVKIVIADIGGEKYYDHALTQIEKNSLIDNIDLLNSGNDSNETANNETSKASPLSLLGYKDKRLLSILQVNERENAKKIKLSTGWERGADGEWRYEEDDRISPEDGGKIVDALRQGGRPVLGRILGADHPLFKEYPQLSLIAVEKMDERRKADGSYDHERGLMQLNIDRIYSALGHSDELLNENVASTLVHETQHAIQQIEGFARGGNLSTYQDIIKSLEQKKDAWRWRNELEEKQAEMPDATSLEVEKALLEEYSDVPEWLPDAATRVKGFNLWVRGYDKEGYEDAYNQWLELVKKHGLSLDGYESYKKLSGEVESRNAERRMGMTDEERRRSLGEETEDVGRDKQVALYDELTDTSDGDSNSYRMVEDMDEIDELESGEKVKVYRAMQVIDGQLYPPMAAVVDGGLVEPTRVGRWYRSDERPDLIDPKTGTWKLNKGQGKGTVPAAYNPYFHTSYSPLNDQFSSAYIRPNLVIVECEVPKSELTSGYKAEHAKDAVGEMSWHSGSVSGALAEAGKPRRVVLSRYAKVTRIVPYSEVADATARLLEGVDVAVPYNVVTPQLRAELEKRGVEISEEASGTVGRNGDFGKAEVVTDEQIASLNAKMQAGARKSAESKRDIAERLSERLGVKITIVDDANTLSDPSNKARERRMRKSKGFFDKKTGEVVVVLPNNADVEDVAATIFHETVGHKGLRELVGDERFDEFLDEVYAHCTAEVRERIAKKAAANGWDFRKATDEYLAELAEKGFEDFDKGERSLWQRLKAKVLEAINKFLKSLKLPTWVKLGDNELRYMLWRSHENLRRGKENVIQQAQDIVKRSELGIDGDAFRMGDKPDTFAERQKRAEEGKGTVMPGLNDAEVKVVDVPRHRYTGNIKEATRQAAEAAKAKYTPDGKAVTLDYNNHGTSFQYEISGSAIDEALNPKQQNKSSNKGAHLSVIEHLDKVIGESIEVEEHPNYSKNEDGVRTTDATDPTTLMHRFYGAINIEGENYQVMTLMRESKGAGEGNGVHAYEVTKVELLDSEPSSPSGVGSVPSNEVSYPLAKLLQDVEKSYDKGKKILEESKKSDESDDLLFRDGGQTEAEQLKDIMQDNSLSLDERRTVAAARMSERHADDLQARQDAVTQIGRNLSELRRAMSAQKKFDVSTVKRAADLYRILMAGGYLSGMNQKEMTSMLASIKASTGREDMTAIVNKAMDIMLDCQTRNAKGTLESMLKVKGSRVDAKGVEVQGMLDAEGARTMKAFKGAMGMQEADIEQAIAEAQNRMGSENNAVATEAAAELAGLDAALGYARTIRQSAEEEKAMRDEMRHKYDAASESDRDTDAFRQYVESVEEAIRANRCERLEAYHNIIGRLTDTLRGSIANAAEFREAEKARVREIQHNANSDMEGRPCDEHHTPTWQEKFMNNSFVQFLFAPLATFDQMLRMFGNKSASGEGYLWNRFMRGWVAAREKEINGVKTKYAELDAKAASVFGKRKMQWGDLIKMERKMQTVTVTFRDGGKMKDHELSQGSALYIYMVNKMSDGRMKLRAMGISQEDVDRIKKQLDPRFVAIADWVQGEFLVNTRNEYNETHKRMFGASMAAIEDYMPLQINGNARVDNPEDLDNPRKGEGISTTTGSIIKRRRNALALDLTKADAFSVILDHISRMEHWNAYAEWNRDLNTLRTYKHFRNQVMNMVSVYGGGEKLWKKFNDLCQITAGTYQPKRSDFSDTAVNLAKGVTAAKVSFRMFTALKQLLSIPAYLPEIDVRNAFNDPRECVSWTLDNLPVIRERWHSRMSGDPRLLKTEVDWNVWRSGILDKATRWGMSPNALIDLVAVSVGAKLIYESRKAQYLKDGYRYEDADTRAKQDATMLTNETQQSSEGSLLSPMQVDRDWFSQMFSVFRNSPISYGRQLYDALRNLKRNLTPGQRDKSIAFMAKQMTRDGIDPEDAEEAARRKFNRQIPKDIMRIAVFGYFIQLIWNLGGQLPYLLFGDDDDEKKKMMDNVNARSLYGWAEGLSGGDIISMAGMMLTTGDFNPTYLSKDMPLTSDIAAILLKLGTSRKSEAVSDIVNLTVQMGIGMNPQSITDAVLAITDACGDDPELAHEAAIAIMRILQVPQSQTDKLYFDEVGLSGDEVSNYTPAQLAERYARYKVMRGRTYAPWSWDDADALGKQEERATRTIKERMGRFGDSEANKAYNEYLESDEYKKQRDLERRYNKAMREDYIEAAEVIADEQDADAEAYERYQNFKEMNKELGNIAKMYLRAKSVGEAALCRKAMEDCKAAMPGVLRGEPDGWKRMDGALGDFYKKWDAMQPDTNQ